MGLISRPDSNVIETTGNEPWITTKLDAFINWGRSNSLWPMPFGTACCAIEFMATAASKYDLARFGMERMAFSPRQSDVLICAGRVPFKLAPVLRRIWQQMPQPKWAISMGACSSSGGMFANYAVVQGADKFMPIDLHIPGCPPRPEAVMYGFNKLQRKIMGNPDQGWRQRYDAAGTEEWARGGPASQPSAEAAEAYDLARERSLA